MDNHVKSMAVCAVSIVISIALCLDPATLSAVQLLHNPSTMRAVTSHFPPAFEREALSARISNVRNASTGGAPLLESRLLRPIGDVFIAEENPQGPHDELQTSDFKRSPSAALGVSAALEPLDHEFANRAIYVHDRQPLDPEINAAIAAELAGKTVDVSLPERQFSCPINLHNLFTPGNGYEVADSRGHRIRIKTTQVLAVDTPEPFLASQCVKTGNKKSVQIRLQFMHAGRGVNHDETELYVYIPRLLLKAFLERDGGSAILAAAVSEEMAEEIGRRLIEADLRKSKLGMTPADLKQAAQDLWAIHLQLVNDRLPRIFPHAMAALYGTNGPYARSNAEWQARLDAVALDVIGSNLATLAPDKFPAFYHIRRGLESHVVFKTSRGPFFAKTRRLTLDLIAMDMTFMHYEPTEHSRIVIQNMRLASKLIFLVGHHFIPLMLAGSETFERLVIETRQRIGAGGHLSENIFVEIGHAVDWLIKNQFGYLISGQPTRDPAVLEALLRRLPGLNPLDLEFDSLIGTSFLEAGEHVRRFLHKPGAHTPMQTIREAEAQGVQLPLAHYAGATLAQNLLHQWGQWSKQLKESGYAGYLDGAIMNRIILWLAYSGQDRLPGGTTFEDYVNREITVIHRWRHVVDFYDSLLAKLAGMTAQSVRTQPQNTEAINHSDKRRRDIEFERNFIRDILRKAGASPLNVSAVHDSPPENSAWGRDVWLKHATLIGNTFLILDTSVFAIAWRYGVYWLPALALTYFALRLFVLALRLVERGGRIAGVAITVIAVLYLLGPITGLFLLMWGIMNPDAQLTVFGTHVDWSFMFAEATLAGFVLMRLKSTGRLIKRIGTALLIPVLLTGLYYTHRGYEAILHNPALLVNVPQLALANPVNMPNTINPNVLDAETLAMLEPILHEQGYREVYDLLLEFSPAARHVVLNTIPVRQLLDEQGILSELRRFNGMSQLFNDDMLTIKEQKWRRRLWEELAGESFSLASVVRHLRDHSGPFAYDRDHQPLIAVASHISLPARFGDDPVKAEAIFNYLRAVRVVHRFGGLYYERAWTKLKHRMDSLPVSQKTPYAWVLFKSLYAYDLDDIVINDLLTLHGGIAKVIDSLQKDPAAYDQIMNHVGDLMGQFRTPYGPHLSFANSQWHLQDYMQFYHDLRRYPATSKNLHVEHDFETLSNLGFKVTPETPGQLSLQATALPLLDRWLSTFGQGKGGPIKLPSVQEFDRFAALYQAMEALSRSDWLMRKVDLTDLLPGADPQAVAKTLRSASQLGPEMARKVAAVLASRYYNPVRPLRAPLRSAGEFRKAVRTLEMLHAFAQIDPRFAHMEDFRNSLFAFTPNVLPPQFGDDLTADDLEGFDLLFQSATRAQREKFEPILSTFMGQHLLKQVNFLDLSSVESIRRNLNSKNPILGDHFIILLGSEFAKAHPLNASSAYYHFQVARLWLQADDQEVNKDIQQIYRVVGNFLGYDLAQYLAAHPFTPRRRELLNDLYDLGVEIPNSQSKLSRIDAALTKAFANMMSGNNRYLASKSIALKSAFQGKIDIQPNDDWILPSAYKAQLLLSHGHPAADLIRADPGLGARALIRFDVGYIHGGVKSKSIGFQEKGWEHVTDFPLAFTTGKGKPTDLSIEEGVVKNWLMSVYYNDGMFITYSDGTVHIADKKRLRMAELYRNPKDVSNSDRVLDLRHLDDFRRFTIIAQEEKLSVNNNMLLIAQGVRQPYPEDTPDYRRLLLQFADGSFGVLNSRDPITTPQAVDLALSAGAQMAIYADTGYYDYMTVYTKNKGPVVVGHSDNPASSNRIFFYQAPPPPKAEAGKPMTIPNLNLKSKPPPQPLLAAA